MNPIQITIDEYNDKNTVLLYYDFLEHIGLLEIEKYLIKKYCEKHLKILDVGCSCGRTTFGLYDMGYTNIIGVDICENMILKARQSCLDKQIFIDFRIGDVKDFVEYGQDVVCFWFNGLMTVPENRVRKVLVDSIYKILNKGGYFIFTTPIIPDDYNYNIERKNIKNKFSSEYGDRIYDNRYYIHFPSDVEILELCNKYELIETNVCDLVCPQSGRGKSLSYKEKYWVVRR